MDMRTDRLAQGEQIIHLSGIGPPELERLKKSVLRQLKRYKTFKIGGFLFLPDKKPFVFKNGGNRGFEVFERGVVTYKFTLCESVFEIQK